MFEAGKEYRVWLERGGNLTSHTGTYFSRDGSLLSLLVEGVLTIYHLGSGSVAYVERVDAAAEEARDKARADAMVQFYS